MKVNGIRAVLAARDALERAGLKRTSPYNGAHVAGWIQPNHYGSTGFSLRGERDGGLNWHVVISGKPHLRYRQWTEYSEGQGTIDLHEPVFPDALFPRIRAVFEELGLDVREVTYGGSQGHWDDDVEYDVKTAHPEWLERPDPHNRAPSEPGPKLRSMTFDTGWRSEVVALRQPLVGYRDGARSYLTRESAQALVEAVAERNRQNAESHAAYAHVPELARNYAPGRNTVASLAEDGLLSVRVPGREPFEGRPETLVNHWGDAVEAWRMPHRWMVAQPSFQPGVPFLLDGEMRESVPFATLDAQEGGDAPWLEQAAAPAPGR